MPRFLLSLALSLALAGSAIASEEIPTPYKSFTLSRESHRAVARALMAPGSYAYRSKLGLFADGKPLTPLSAPKGKMKRDASFGRVEVLEGRFAFSAAIPAGALAIQSVDQACSETVGICFPARAIELDLRSGATRELSMERANALAQALAASAPPSPRLP